MRIFPRIVCLFYLVTVAKSKDEYRPYSQVDIENEKYIKQIHENPFPAIVTKHNLELLELLQKEDYVPSLKPPEIEITNKEIISKLHKYDDLEEETAKILRLIRESQQVRQDLAIASVLGAAGDLSPNDMPQSAGEINMVVAKKNRDEVQDEVQIVDIDNPNLEIEPVEFFLYTLDSFKFALELLQNDTIKTKSLERLKKIFPKQKNIEEIFYQKLQLIQEAITDSKIRSFFEDEENYDKILKLQNGEISIDQISPSKVRKWLIKMSQFNDKVFEIVDDVAQSLSVNSAQSLLSTEQRLEL